MAYKIKQPKETKRKINKELSIIWYSTGSPTEKGKKKLFQERAFASGYSQSEIINFYTSIKKRGVY